MECGRSFTVSECLDRIDEQTWLEIAARRCDRA
jgi:hypothetical protein